MGIGFVLIVWAFLLVVLGTPAVIVLLIVANRTGGRARAKRILRWGAIAAPLMVGYAGAGFLAYALWCSEVRGVDPGIGDWSSIPLGAGFNLSFIDVLDEAFIPERNATDGLAVEAGITQVGQSGDYVYGLEGSDTAFVLDTRSGTLRRTHKSGLSAELRRVGVINAGLEPVGAFYVSRRWGWPDLAAAVVLVLPALLIGWRSVRHAWVGIDLRVA